MKKMKKSSDSNSSSSNNNNKKLASKKDKAVIQDKLSEPLNNNNNHSGPPIDSLYVQANGKSTNDTVSTASISGLTATTIESSYYGIGSHYGGYEVDSSLRVLGPGANSEISSVFSADIQSNASIRSKPWVSKELSPPTDDYFKNNSEYDDDDDDVDKNEKDTDDYKENRSNNYTDKRKKYKENQYDTDGDDKIDINIKVDDFDDGRAIDSNKATDSKTPPLYANDDQLIQQQQPQADADEKQQRRWSENGNSTQRLAKIKAGLFFSRK
ncbi:unnamed protein product [Cunninghamella echinulata]